MWPTPEALRASHLGGPPQGGMPADRQSRLRGIPMEPSTLRGVCMSRQYVDN